MTVRFYIKSKSTKRGNAVYCYIRQNKQTLTINTGQKVKPEHWNKDFQRANIRKTRDPHTKKALKDLNQFLDVFETKIFEIEREVRRKDFNAGFNKIADEIKNHFTKRKAGFFDIYDEFLQIKRQEVTKPSIQKLNRVKDLLQEYEQTFDVKLDFDNITPLFFSKFQAFLVENKGMLNNTAGKIIQFFKSFMIWCNNNNYTQNTSYKSFKGKSEANEVIFLTEEELMQLYNLELDNERLERARDIFVFQCFTGVRYSDIKNIRREDIKGNSWEVRTKKTHQILQIPLNNYAQSILAKYSEFPQPLPVISNQKMNLYIKELCEKAEITEPVKIVRYKGKEAIEEVKPKYQVIGTHTARRTFISLSLRKGMKPDVIMAITGHSTYRMMQRYLKIADDHKQEEMEKVWGSLRAVK